jgi:hypothetical protein
VIDNGGGIAEVGEIFCMTSPRCVSIGPGRLDGFMDKVDG